MGRRIHIYTDGSCNNREAEDHLRVGGFGVVVVLPKNKNKNRLENKILMQKGTHIEAPTTSSRAEIMGMLDALKYVRDNEDGKTKWEIFCDSQYVIKSFNENWLASWAWGNFSKPKNSDLWRQMWDIWQGELKFLKGRLVFTHIRGHRGHTYNELADDLAGEARTKYLNSIRNGTNTEG